MWVLGFRVYRLRFGPRLRSDSSKHVVRNQSYASLHFECMQKKFIQVQQECIPWQPLFASCLCVFCMYSTRHPPQCFYVGLPFFFSTCERVVLCVVFIFECLCAFLFPRLLLCDNSCTFLNPPACVCVPICRGRSLRELVLPLLWFACLPQTMRKPASFCLSECSEVRVCALHCLLIHRCPP